jgi:hypothetical protein
MVRIFQLITFSATFWSVTFAAPQPLHHGTKTGRGEEQVVLSTNNANQLLLPPKSEVGSAKPV